MCAKRGDAPAALLNQAAQNSDLRLAKQRGMGCEGMPRHCKERVAPPLATAATITAHAHPRVSSTGIHAERRAGAWIDAVVQSIHVAGHVCCVRRRQRRQTTSRRLCFWNRPSSRQTERARNRRGHECA